MHRSAIGAMRETAAPPLIERGWELVNVSGRYPSRRRDALEAQDAIAEVHQAGTTPLGPIDG
jgi:hypothetical protein